MPSYGAAPSPTERKPPTNTSPPSKTLRHEAFKAPSSPRSSHDRKDRSTRPRRTRKSDDLLAVDQPAHGAFFDDVSPVDGTRLRDDCEDPHDLSFSSKHVPRASMVDSMVLSLDQFSSGGLGSFDYNPQPKQNHHNHQHHQHQPQQIDSGSRYSSKAIYGRKKGGHVATSSVSSDGEISPESLSTVFGRSMPRMVRRGSMAKYGKDAQRLPAIFSGDEDSARGRLYDPQREAQLSNITNLDNVRLQRKGSRSSAASSVDLSHLAAMAGRLGRAGDRRSRSFDFGSRAKPEFSVEAPDAIDQAPMPVVFGGPEAQTGPSISIIPGAPLVRKNSTKSSKSAFGRKSRAGTLGNNNNRPKAQDQMPGLPVLTSLPSFSNAMPELRPNPAPAPLESGHTLRPGFFRRVFGSSRTVSPSSENLSAHFERGEAADMGRSRALENSLTNHSVGKLQKPPRRESTDKEHPPVVTKKSSAFFRRRRKSISDEAPPPPSLTLSATVKGGAPNGDVSPVSSLRAFMDPFLVHGESYTRVNHENTRPESPQRYHTAQSTPQIDSVSFENRSKVVSDKKSPPPLETVPTLEIPSSKHGAKLRVQHQESFLADSSSVEELGKHSKRQSPSPTFKSNSAVAKKSLVEHGVSFPPGQPSGSAAGSKSGTPSNSRPLIPPRADSWKNPSYTPSPSKITEPATRHNTNIHSFAGAGQWLEPTSPPPPEPVKASPVVTLSKEAPRNSPRASESDASEYKSAPSTPLVQTSANQMNYSHSPIVHISHPSMSTDSSREKARKLFDNRDETIDPSEASAWLGDSGKDRELVRQAYMELFDWKGFNILAALRGLCDRIALKGESQQVDRMLDAFALRWCECNSSHGFKSRDVVHTICYSLLLLNTDLHLADIGKRMTRGEFVRNALPTIKRVAATSEENDSSRAASPAARIPTQVQGTSIEQDVAPVIGSTRPAERMAGDESVDADAAANISGPLVEAPFIGTAKGWDSQIETVLKSFYNSISRQRLPLFGAPAETVPQPQPSNNLLSMTSNMLRRTPSTISKGQGDNLRGRAAALDSQASRWATKTRSRPRRSPGVGLGFDSSRTSLDDQSSTAGWSPSMSSTWSKAKTLTSISVDSFGSTNIDHAGTYQSSIGFANALSQAIIRDDQLDLPTDDCSSINNLKAGALLEDESLELCGAPWAKEGMMKHKCHLDGVDKRSKDRNWNDCFAVIEKGWMRLFSFKSVNAKSMRQKSKNVAGGGVVGGGNWQDSAEEVWKFLLRHTIASSLPPPGYSKARPFVWALSLPNGAVHLFSVGTPDIVKEFVTTANYWSARLSKEPLMGAIGSMEFGWSDNIINRAPIGSGDSQDPKARSMMSPTPRPSTQASMRSSIDHGGSRLKHAGGGEKIHINDWVLPSQSMHASSLMEVDQLSALQTYVKNVEADLAKHNELRPAMLLAFAAGGRLPAGSNSGSSGGGISAASNASKNKAMTNWEKKSAYLLREIVKFRTYIDALELAARDRERIYRMRKEEEEYRKLDAEAARA